MPRRGFTLVEMLVATGVFMFGFTAAFAMFLAATRSRAQADGLLRLSLAATSLSEEFRLEAGREASAPKSPADYVGDGFAGVASDDEAATGAAPSLSDHLFRYTPQPGVWYRVLSCVGESDTGDVKLNTSLEMDLLVVWNPMGETSITLDDLAKRIRYTGTDVAGLVGEISKRGFALREKIVVVRRPSWQK